MHLTIVAGARPNFMKIAPVIHAINERNSTGTSRIDFRLVHTGQHYDNNMSDTFFRQLGIPAPDVNLEAGGGTQAEQTALVMTRFESFLSENSTDLVIVVGDVTSTLSCSVVAKKMNIRVAHIEGGIRSGDWTMPEEINRVVTDSITDYFFTTSEVAGQNLKREGVSEDRIFFVGNTMIDTLVANLDKLQKPDVWDGLNLREEGYFVMTLHRPANVDDDSGLRRRINRITTNVEEAPVIFPVHPRTRHILKDSGISAANLHMTNPMGYLEFIYLLRHARAIITDSGGVTEEATVLGVPCLTLRDNTERPETVTLGTNELIGTDPGAIKPALDRLLRGNWKKGGIPEKWDGHSSGRILEALLKLEQQGLLSPPEPRIDKSLLFPRP